MAETWYSIYWFEKYVGKTEDEAKEFADKFCRLKKILEEEKE